MISLLPGLVIITKKFGCAIAKIWSKRRTHYATTVTECGSHLPLNVGSYIRIA